MSGWVVAWLVVSFLACGFTGLFAYGLGHDAGQNGVFLAHPELLGKSKDAKADA